VEGRKLNVESRELNVESRKLIVEGGDDVGYDDDFVMT